MKRELIRVGSLHLANESTLNSASGFDVLFNGYHEFVYMADGNDAWARVNGTWLGGFGHLINGILWIGLLKPYVRLGVNANFAILYCVTKNNFNFEFSIQIAV